MSGEGLFTRVCFFQFEIATGDPMANLATVQRLLARCQPPAGSLVVLPELWATGFAVNDYPAMAAATPELLEKLVAVCAGSGLVIAGSLLEPCDDPQGKPWNTMFVVSADGVLGRYRKQHLFPLWQEEKVLAPGNRPAPIGTPHGVLGPLICYDIRFAELGRHHAAHGAPLLVVSAQWPKSRLEQWRLLLRARAIENQVFVVATNGCGRAGETVLAGHSMVIAPDGSVLAEAAEGEECGCVPLDPTGLLELRHRFCSVGEHPWLHRDRDKICTLGDLLEKVRKIRNQSSRVAFTNGCFDLLHSGHVSYLEQARQTADYLIVGVNSDRSVRALKGAGRPVNSEQDRQRVLAALGCVDFVVLFDEDTPHRLITALMPDVLVKGADWAEDEIVGSAEVKAAGGRVVRVPFTHQCSTTALIEKIQQ